jgi:probable rRNA maturation factor
MVILRKRVPGVEEASLGRFVTRACRALSLRGKVNVLVTNSRELHVLNRRFLGKDKPTDVLSFPPISELPRDFAGDVAISADIASQNARALGHSVTEELKILSLHGLLHLAGYDHQRDNGRMARKEHDLRRKLGLPVALIERAGNQARTKAAGKRTGATPVQQRRRT